MYFFRNVMYIINVFACRELDTPNGRKYAKIGENAVHKGKAPQSQDKTLQKSMCKGNAPKPQDKALQKNLHRRIYAKSQTEKMRKKLKRFTQ